MMSKGMTSLRGKSPKIEYEGKVDAGKGGNGGSVRSLWKSSPLVLHSLPKSLQRVTAVDIAAGRL